MATQMNTFVIATDLGDKTVTPIVIRKNLEEVYFFAKRNYTGWPRGLQSALSVISILISTNIPQLRRTIV